MHTWDYQTFEVTANCTPARLAAIAEDFGLQLQQAWLQDGVRLPLIPSITATVADGGLVRVDIESNVFSTIIHALPRGDGRTQVRVEPGAGWGAEESWAALWAELARLGYVEQETIHTVKPLSEVIQTEQAAAARKGKPGRPRNLDDAWAWQQVNALGRPPTEVKREWIARIGDRWELAADQERMWRAAIDPSRRNPEEKD